MNDSLKRGIRNLTPPVLLNLAKKFAAAAGISVGNSAYFTGNYPGWRDAAAAAKEGYTAPVILECVRTATGAVRDRKAADTRDAVVFDAPQWNFALLACLLRVAALSGNRLRVLDFGGALGSTFFHCRRFFSNAIELNWCIVDQPHFYECGRKEFQGNEVHFCPDLNTSLSSHRFDVILLSSVLQYLPEPHNLLRQIIGSEIQWMLIDRTPVIEGIGERITLEQVPAYIYGKPLAYPARLFGNDSLREELGKHWNIILESPAIDSDRNFDEGVARYRLFLCESHERSKPNNL